MALCNALEISPSVLLQDSLSEGVMRSQLTFERENQDLMEGLMHVLREHSQKKRDY